MTVHGFAILADGNLAHCAVVLRIGAAGVAGQASSEQSVVQAGVEFDGALLRAARDEDAAQCLVPSSLGLSPCLVKRE